MDTLLTSLGLLLIATTLTLMVFSPRTWLVAFAHGFGIQGIIGGLASAIQVGFVVENSGAMPIWQRVQFAVQGMSFHAAGWTARTAYDASTAGTSGSPQSHLDQYLPIAAIQMSAIALIIAWRKMRDNDNTDSVLILLVLLLLANSGANIMLAWWN
jgi:hypothetical protein